MLSYRHAFHAGNHADVLKHAIAIQLMRYLGNKETAFMAIDTHAGAGVYGLEDTYARKSGESQLGIARLWNRKDLPPLFSDYLDLVRSFNPDGRLRFYPGSPFIAERVLREQDRLRLFELHTTDARLLEQNIRKLETEAALQGQRPAARGKRVSMTKADGFAGLKALLPPPTRRGLVLIDPPYEDKNDYRRVTEAIADSLKRFPTGVYAVWYPVLYRQESRQLSEKLKRLAPGAWLNVVLSVAAPSPDGFGLRASGMFVFNPPWTLEAALKEAMPWLVDVLAQDSTAGYVMESGEAHDDKPAAAGRENRMTSRPGR